jgi:hypothetical protein
LIVADLRLSGLCLPSAICAHALLGERDTLMNVPRAVADLPRHRLALPPAAALPAELR